MTTRGRTAPRGSSRDRAIARKVATWFNAHARDLPWRRHRDGYTGLVSEAMLQQTQVKRVMESYEAFMQRFPTVEALAEADEQAVLASWNGLGYYRRAKHLHAAAQAVVERFSGEVPRTAHELIALPGVGRYTAGAIASIVFGERTPVVDGNVQRVVARLESDERPLTDAGAREATWQRAAALVNAADDPAALNEGLMELGALVCAPRSPRCGDCPLRSHCLAFKRGTVDHIPPVKKHAERKTVHHHAMVAQRRGCVLLQQRPSTGLWASMWQPVTIEHATELDGAALAAAAPISFRSMQRIDDFVHITTHRRVVFHVYRATTSVRRGEWVPVDALTARSMSNAHRRVLEVAGVL